MNLKSAQDGTVITFYSYKGGTGRSMAVANTAYLLANHVVNLSQRILIIDWDLEAPGLEKFFEDRLAQPENLKRPGLLNYFFDVKKLLDKSPHLYKRFTSGEGSEVLEKEIPLSNYLVKEIVGGGDFMKAGLDDPAYPQLVSSFNWVEFYNKYNLVITAFRELISKKYAYCLIDSRTGLTDTSGICTMLMPEKLVAVFAPNRQNLGGVLNMMRQAVNYRSMSEDFRPLVVFPLPSRIELNEKDLRAQWRDDYQREFEKLFTEIYGLEECNLTKYFDDVQLPHVSYYAYGENIAVLEERSEAISLNRAYRSFFERLIELEVAWDEDVQVDSLPLNAIQHDVDQAELGQQDFFFDVFISYSHRDRDWVRSWLLPRLESAGLRVCIDFRDFKLGTPGIINLEKAISRSRKILLILTPDWIQSEWSSFEMSLVSASDPLGTRRRIVPLLLKESIIPDRLSIFTFADFTDSNSWDAQLTRVISAISESPAMRPAIPTRAPNLVHPYPLQANFTGRLGERKELTAWLADDVNPIFVLVAMGGMGKSALAWYWVINDVLTPTRPTPAFASDGVMWWSFDEGESSFAKFVDAALKYVSGQPIDVSQLPTTYDRAQELRRQLQAKRVLFILDGFERQLRAYARLDAAYQSDDATDPTVNARACAEPIVAQWLLDIAAGTTRAKVLLTTRLMIYDLEDRAGDVLAGVLTRELKELPRDDAVEFMRAQGVTKGTSAEIAAVCEAYGNHPLSLRLVSSLIARDKRTPGDVAAAPRHDVHGDLVQRQHHILEQSYNALSEKERTLLSRIAAFRSPVTYDALAIFNEVGSEAAFDTLLDDLQTRGLLQRDITSNRYDLHPIVRHYAYDRLTDKKGVHTRLLDYFAKIPVPDQYEVHSVEDLMPIIELYYHTIGAGEYDEAAELFFDRLATAFYFRLGAYRNQIELLRALFPDGEERPPRLKSEKAQAWVLSALANSYGVSGQPRRAISLFKQQNAIREKQGDKKNLGIELGNIAIQQILLGELASGERNLHHSIELLREIQYEFGEVVARRELGRLMGYRGAFDEASLELDIVLELLEKQSAAQGIGVVWQYRALQALLMNDAQATLEAAQRARTLAGVERYERDIIQAEWLLGAALVMEGRDLNTAAAHLTEALTRCRRINLVELEPDILLTWARWHRARGNGQEALAYAEEALAIADRCEFRLKQAEIHNFMARLAMDGGERELAREHAERAREQAWCDGPPYCYKPALDETEGMLRELDGE